MSGPIPACHRFTVGVDGGHRHNLGLPVKRRRLSLRWFQKNSDEEQESLIKAPQTANQVELSEHVTATESFSDCYGTCKKIIHYGSTSTVRLYQKSKQLYVVKAYHTSHQFLDPDAYIGFHLRHHNVVRTLDLQKHRRGDQFLVMEYCDGGDLHSVLLSSTSGKLVRAEADCFFKQILQGVTYLHNNGIAHRNLRLQSVALTSNGCVKIIDFDRAQTVYTPSEAIPKHRTLSSLSTNLNSLYMAPEEYIRHPKTDYRTADVWAVGIIYIAMRSGHVFWNTAEKGHDPRYDEYVKRRSEESFEPIEALEETTCRNVIYAMLDPKYERRISASEALRSEWVHSIVLCDAGKHAS